MSSLEAALAVARRGYRIFPLPENAKGPPLFEGWQGYATRKESVIRNWWGTWKKANIGIYTHDLLVVDIDPRNEGMESFTLLQMTDDFPKTAITNTAGGGNHLIYKLPIGRTASGDSNRVAKGVDAKASGGYVVAPGSVIDGKKYMWRNDNEPALAPDWLINQCQKKGQKLASAGKVLVEDTDNNIVDCKTYLTNRSPEADEGARNTTATKVANALYDIGVSVDTCREFLCEWSDAKCHPALGFEELQTIAASARNTRDKAIGCKSRDYVAFEAGEIDESRKPASIPQGARHGDDEDDEELVIPGVTDRKIYLVSFKDSVAYATKHASNPLVKGLIDCGAMSVVYGESNSGKSFTELDKDFHIAAGLPWGGMAVKQGAVLYVAAEGGTGIHKRMAAMSQHYGRDDVPLFIVPCPVNLLRSDADLKPLLALAKQAEELSGQKIIKVTIDTLSRVISGGEENSSVDMGALVKHFDAIRAATGCHLAVIHHTGKDRAKGARGHSLLRAATDTEIEIADRTIRATKQRDMDGDLEMLFNLKGVRVGVDPNGEPVDSCYVEVGRQGQEGFKPMPSNPAFRALKVIYETYREKPEEVFGWQFLATQCQKIRSDKVLLRPALTGYLSELSKKGFLKKVMENQYVMNVSEVSEIVRT